MRKKQKIHSYRSRTLNIILVFLGIIILLIVGISVYSIGKYVVRSYMLLSQENACIQTENTDEEYWDEKEQEIYHDGKTYVYNKNLKNVLFMGVDKTGEVQMNDIPGKGGQADSLVLLRIDKEKKTFNILQISRDSMIPVDVYDINGEYFTSEEAQISTQYAFGNGEKKSCWLMKKKVSELLYSIPINGYFSMNISAISLINDAIGGVTLTVPEDYTNIDPAFQKGATITLKKEMAERYVRGRDTSQTGSNDSRMERQMQYMQAFLGQIRKKYSVSNEYADVLWKIAQPYMVTDLTAEELKTLFDYRYTPEENRTVPGKTEAGEIYDEFHVDDDALYELILEQFYIEKQN